jgi:hypothetical protein
MCFLLCLQIFSTNIQIYSSIKFHENPSSVAQLIHEDEQTTQAGRRDDDSISFS